MNIYLDDPPTGKINFQVPAGLSRSFPVSAFEVEEKEEVKGGGGGVGSGSAAVEVKEV